MRFSVEINGKSGVHADSESAIPSVNASRPERTGGHADLTHTGYAQKAPCLAIEHDDGWLPAEGLQNTAIL